MQGDKRKKALRNRAVKSPSPDYCNANTSRKTSSPFRQLNTNHTHYIHQSQVHEKSSNKHITPITEFETHSPERNQQHLVTQRNASNQQDQISIASIYHKLRTSFMPFFSDGRHPNSKQQMLSEIELCIDNIIRSKSQTWVQPAQVPHEFSVSTTLINKQQYELENRKLRRELTTLKIELQNLRKVRTPNNENKSPGLDVPKNRLTFSPITKNTSAENTLYQKQDRSQCEQTLKQSLQMEQFFVSKISYLENELQSKIVKLSLLEKQKNTEILRLKEKLEKTNTLIANEMKSYNMVISQQKQQIEQLQRQLTDLQTNTPALKMSDRRLEPGQATFSFDSESASRIRDSPIIKSRKNFEEYDFKECFSEEEGTSEMNRRRSNDSEWLRETARKRHLAEILVESLREIRQEVEQAISLDNEYHQQPRLGKQTHRLQLENTELQEKLQPIDCEASQQEQLLIGVEEEPIIDSSHITAKAGTQSHVRQCEETLVWQNRQRYASAAKERLSKQQILDKITQMQKDIGKELNRY